MEQATASLPLAETMALTDAINSNPGNVTVTDQQVAAFIATLPFGDESPSATIERLTMETKFNDAQAVSSAHVLGEEAFNLH